MLTRTRFFLLNVHSFIINVICIALVAAAFGTASLLPFGVLLRRALKWSVFRQGLGQTRPIGTVQCIVLVWEA